MARPRANGIPRSLPDPRRPPSRPGPLQRRSADPLAPLSSLRAPFLGPRSLRRRPPRERAETPRVLFPIVVPPSPSRLLVRAFPSLSLSPFSTRTFSFSSSFFFPSPFFLRILSPRRVSTRRSRALAFLLCSRGRCVDKRQKCRGRERNDGGEGEKKREGTRGTDSMGLPERLENAVTRIAGVAAASRSGVTRRESFARFLPDPRISPSPGPPSFSKRRAAL